MGKLSRTKGKIYERRVANALKAVYPDAKRSYGQSREGHDEPDVKGTPWWIECTHGKRPNILAKFEQGADARTKHAAHFGVEYEGPIVVSRKDGDEDLVTLPLEVFISLLINSQH